MGNAHLPNGRQGGQIDSPAPRPHVHHFDVDALVRENKQLRELVVQLSEIVVKNVLNRQ
jgi:hypothetical protein